MSSMKVKAKEKGGVIEVKALIKHPMETGQRKDKKTGKPIPAHFVQEITVEHGGKTRVTADWSGGVSKNPLLFVKFKGGAKGDMVKISWTDNQGGSDSVEEAIT
ncbi:MAG: thiosulfate oxidation carrier complex protein SoxZ [Gammaproteobacteria bacterium]|jgi:sulfur-oxidizing protein SoxZ